MKGKHRRSTFNYDNHEPISEALTSVQAKKKYPTPRELSDVDFMLSYSQSTPPTIQERVGLKSTFDPNGQQIDTLQANLTHSKWTLRVEALRTLEKMGKEVPPEIASMIVLTLQDESPFVRAAAVRAIGSISATKYKNALMIASADLEWSVRAASLEALGTLERCAPVKTLLKGLDDEDSTVQIVAIWALVKLKERAPIDALVNMLEDGNELVRAAAAGALGRLPDYAPVDPLVKLLQDECGIVRTEAAETLGKLGKRIPIDALVKSLQDEDPIVRATAIWSLGNTKEKLPIELIVCMLQDPHDEVRIAAAKVLGTINQNFPLESLLEALLTTSQETKVVIEDSIEQTLKRTPIDFLLCALHHASPNVRTAAMWALGQRNHQLSNDVIAHALQDSHQVVRMMATNILHHQYSRIPIQPLSIVLRNQQDTSGLYLHENDRISKTQIHHSLMNFFKENSGHIERIYMDKADKHILVLHCRHSATRYPLQQVLTALGSNLHVESLHDALNSSDECIRKAATQIWVSLQSQAWTESFILSLGLMEDVKKEVELFSSQECPEQIVVCSVNSNQVPTEDQPSLFYQLKEVWPSSWKEQMCTSEEILLDFKLWHSVCPPSTQRERGKSHS